MEPLALTQPLWLSCPLPVLHCTLRQQPRVQWGIPLPILTSLQYGAVSLRPLKQMDLLAPHSRPVNTNGLPLQKEAIRLPADREATNCLTPQGSWGGPHNNACLWRCQLSHYKWNRHPQQFQGSHELVPHMPPTTHGTISPLLTPTTYPSLQVESAAQGPCIYQPSHYRCMIQVIVHCNLKEPVGPIEPSPHSRTTRPHHCKGT